MLDLRGTKSIHSRVLMTDTKHITLAATVSVSGKMLSPFLVFKGNPTGWIAMPKFTTYQSAGKYTCKVKAWMDKVKMHEWIDLCLIH
jgi:hypothetical protein